MIWYLPLCVSTRLTRVVFDEPYYVGDEEDAQDTREAYGVPTSTIDLCYPEPRYEVLQHFLASQLLHLFTSLNHPGRLSSDMYVREYPFL